MQIDTVYRHESGRPGFDLPHRVFFFFSPRPTPRLTRCHVNNNRPSIPVVRRRRWEGRGGRVHGGLHRGLTFFVPSSSAEDSHTSMHSQETPDVCSFAAGNKTGFFPPHFPIQVKEAAILRQHFSFLFFLEEMPKGINKAANL